MNLSTSIPTQVKFVYNKVKKMKRITIDSLFYIDKIANLKYSHPKLKESFSDSKLQFSHLNASNHILQNISFLTSSSFSNIIFTSTEILYKNNIQCQMNRKDMYRFLGVADRSSFHRLVSCTLTRIGNT